MSLRSLCVSLALLCAMLTLSHAAVGCKEPDYQTLELGSATRYKFPVYSNLDLASADMSSIKHVIVIQHGIGRTAPSYCAYGMKLLEANPARAKETLLVAPKFVGQSDQAGYYDGCLVFNNDGWSDGENSVQPVNVSSYQVMDDLLSTFSNRKRYSSLKSVILAGHSAGAQLTQRYAILNEVEGVLSDAKISMEYFIANPSSYLYLTDERPTSTGGYAPYSRTVCPKYNRFKYGLERLIAYAKETNASKLRTRYAGRKVTYLLGTADNDSKQKDLDTSCQGEAQGPQRFARGTAYMRYEDLQACKFKETTKRERYGVIDVGHTAGGMYCSVCAAEVLLGKGAKACKNGAACNTIAQVACP